MFQGSCGTWLASGCGESGGVGGVGMAAGSKGEVGESALGTTSPGFVGSDNALGGSCGGGDSSGGSAGEVMESCGVA